MFEIRQLRMCCIGVATVSALLAADAAAAERKAFASAQEAAAALVKAVEGRNESAIQAILGPSLEEWIRSGDPVADAKARESFIADYNAKHSIDNSNAGKATLLIGDDDFPFPIPIVWNGRSWSFDPQQGKQEIIDRRVGQNELATIETLLAIADAEDEYVANNLSGKRAPEYASKFSSSAGKHDGLYWPTAGGEKESPLGSLVSEAELAGYKPSGAASGTTQNPYHGYYFRILTKQGNSAPGGAYDFLANGRLIGGYAVIAWPAKYGASGYKTFMISHDRDIYEADLGPDTSAVVANIQSFDPDTKEWTRVAPE